jgi:hypothetical protein
VPRPSVIVEVDEQLQWVLSVPELIVGAARAATPDDVAAMSAFFDALSRALATPDAALDGDVLADRVGRAVRAALSDQHGLPDLPFIGEPFGGEGGTD